MTWTFDVNLLHQIHITLATLIRSGVPLPWSVANLHPPCEHCKNITRSNIKRAISYKHNLSYTKSITGRYGSTGCGVFKRGILKKKDFCMKINIPKGNY